ncbi:hypothetical protein [Radiobacillus sp. PE A8.2]|uniref:hypothetical protein n=1 Tax=Radiobacillus sp. PE A8.2 TaxID=3380349 RepID=UPI0038908426
MVRKLLLGLILLVFLLGCNSKDEVDSPIYKGKFLDIGVIGESPDVREQNVNFQRITFDKLKSTTPTDHDAIFIMKEYLEQAGENQYAHVYKQLDIPVFFIQSTQAYLPFILDDLTYKESTFNVDQTYATGIISQDDGFNTWGYGLYNDTENETNVRDVYTRIFTTIEAELR